ncbi:transmembrane protein 245-like [Cimex lectularius]|uniref:Transmembrane protein 245 n=1 Tax=Cimex lectularius TaxID=79782 RepID=A0A8I6RAD2_CIMLE|nr:transmembrane protein 245-like [Cimex lectularius]XP_014240773.1 transmembrane protein 245-like [Cimex lectularius]
MEPRKKKSVFSMGEIFNTFSNDGESNDKAFKLAMFNALAMIVVLISVITLSGVYFILQPFIKPLAWALLCGSALHPFKEIIANKCRREIDNLESSSRPVYVNLLLIPFDLTSRWSDSIGDFLVDRMKIIITFLLVLSTMSGFYFYTPNFIWNLCYFSMVVNKMLINTILDTFRSTLISGTVVLSFFCALIFLWKPNYNRFFTLSSIFVWVVITSWLSNCIFYLRIPIFVLLQFAICGIYLYSLMSTSPTSIDLSQTEQKENPPESETFLKEEKEEGQTSFLYIRWLMMICAGVLTFSLSTVPYILVFLLLIYGIKKTCFYFGITDTFNSYVSSLVESVGSWYDSRKDILLPPPLQASLTLLTAKKMRLLDILKNCCDSVAAVAVILGLLLFGLFFSIFFTVQAYREGVYLVQAGGRIINSTIVNNPELIQILPKDWQTTKNTALENVYIYTRDGIAQFIRNLLKGKGIDEFKISELEKGALDLWDIAYESWVKPMETNVGRSTTADTVFNSYTNFIERLKKTPEVVSWDSLREFVQENMSMLNAGFDSLWVILKGNLSLLIGILTTVFSLVFGGGMSVINFTFHTVVFLTALFYLLSTSREMYKPVEMMTQMSPKYGKKLALAVQQSCREVLAASIKLSMFYGLWTWLIHTFFMSNLVYMPAAFAAILGVVPVLGTYWACVPAILDLWLLQDSKIRALGLFLAQIFPTAIVETTVYNEIKGGGHPYLTGLSIAGGMFWLGMEGAIAGPLVLCFVFTIVNMVSSFNSDDSS